MGKTEELIGHIGLPVSLLCHLKNLLLDELVKAKTLGNSEDDGDNGNDIEQGIVGQNRRFLPAIVLDESPCGKDDHTENFDGEGFEEGKVFQADFPDAHINEMEDSF